jgi:peptidyl-prolyl cis-trans isomerase SurA
MSKRESHLFYLQKHQQFVKHLLTFCLFACLGTSAFSQTKDKKSPKSNTTVITSTTAKAPAITINTSQINVNKDLNENANPNDIDRVIAIVNREVITEHELKTRIELITKQFVEVKKPLPSKEIVQKEVLERLIDESIMYQEATILGVRVLEQELDGILNNIANQNKLTLEQFKIETEKSGTNWDKYKQSIRRDVVISRYRERSVESKLKISDAEIDAFISTQIKKPQSNNVSGALEPEMIDIAQILIPIPTGANSSEIASLQSKAQTIYDQSSKEAEFMKYANQLAASDKTIRVQDLGYRTIDRLPQVFVEATKDLSTGDLAPKVIQTAAGFHILKVLDRKSSASASQSNNSESIYITQSEVNQMMLTVNQGTSEEEVIRRLKTFRDQIKAKTVNFTDIAKKYSEDPSVVKNQGYLGWISPGQVPPEVDVALSRLNPGELSDPFQTEFGWHIVQLINRRQSEVTAAQQKEYARAALRQSKLLQANEDWIRELRDNATIELRPPYTMTK